MCNLNTENELLHMLEQIMQYLIQNDNEYILHKRFPEIENNLVSFYYDQMKSNTPKKDILDFNKSSMFSRCDPIEIIITYTNNANNSMTNSHANRIKLMSLNDKENKLRTSIDNLKIEDNKGKQLLKVSKFTGLQHASDFDYGSLRNYGSSLLTRDEWKKQGRSGTYYGFETEDDYKYLKKELFESEYPSIKNAILHTWSNQLYVQNDDNSHRLAALYRQDTNQNNNTMIKLQLEENKLNIDNAKIIFDNFIGIITTDSTYFFLTDLLTDISKKYVNTKILLEEDLQVNGRLYILWIEKPQNELVSNIVKFINRIPSDRCYMVNNTLGKYLQY